MKSARDIYDQLGSDGGLLGQPTPKDLCRFRTTQRLLMRGASTLLDVGCNTGEWLGYLQKQAGAPGRLTGIDVAESRIQTARSRFPAAEFRCGDVQDLAAANEHFDVVTCLEVLEHLPEWRPALACFLKIATRQVLVSVPYRERIAETVCIHCSKPTPLYGHLHSFDRDSFPDVPGWQRSTSLIARQDPRWALSVRLYRWWRPSYGWLAVRYDKTA